MHAEHARASGRSGGRASERQRRAGIARLGRVVRGALRERAHAERGSNERAEGVVAPCHLRMRAGSALVCLRLEPRRVVRGALRGTRTRFLNSALRNARNLVSLSGGARTHTVCTHRQPWKPNARHDTPRRSPRAPARTAASQLPSTAVTTELVRPVERNNRNKTHRPRIAASHAVHPIVRLHVR